jgi:threonylcarbamoyladenosine tRNA methylthiotransferase MtaB
VPRAQIIDASCSRRSLELEQVRCFLQGNGYTLSRDDWRVDAGADLILLSTCGFTAAAEDLSLEALLRVQQGKRAGARVLLGGCVPEINPGRVAREFGGSTFSPRSYARLDDLVGATRPLAAFPRPNSLQPPTLLQDVRRACDLFRAYDGSLSGLGYISRRLGNGLRKRLITSRYANLRSEDTFYIQIQEGCSMLCSYCVICKAIGPLRSKPLDAVIEELQAGLDRGYRNVQLLGDNAGSYGLDTGTNMGELLSRIEAVEGRFDLDLTDINPVYLPLITAPAVKLASEGRLARLYVPVQSGSRRILRLMNRDCDLAAVQQVLLEIRQAAGHGLTLGTSLIVGFPSETREDLEQTVDFCLAVGFDWVWCHSFSARPETPAAGLPGQIAPEEVLQRARWVKARLGQRTLVATADDTAGSRTCQG